MDKERHETAKALIEQLREQGDNYYAEFVGHTMANLYAAEMSLEAARLKANRLRLDARVLTSRIHDLEARGAS